MEKDNLLFYIAENYNVNLIKELDTDEKLFRFVHKTILHQNNVINEIERQLNGLVSLINQ